MKTTNFKLPHLNSEAWLLWLGVVFWDDMPTPTPTLDALCTEWA